MKEVLGKPITVVVMAMLAVARLRRTARQEAETGTSTLAEWLVRFAYELSPFVFWGLGIAYLLSELRKPPSPALLLIGIAWFLAPFFFGRWVYHTLRITRQVLAQPARSQLLQEGAQFYSSPEWRKLRESVIREEGEYCDTCGIRIANDEDIMVDHIFARNKHPELALRRDNLRVLCRTCSLAAT